MKNISGSSKTKSDKSQWFRKRRKLDDVISKEIQPIEENILELMHKKQKLIDKVMLMRKELVENCIHPEQDLVYNEEDRVQKARCKFCEKKVFFLNEKERN
jgi:hypothetical protein